MDLPRIHNSLFNVIYRYDSSNRNCRKCSFFKNSRNDPTDCISRMLQARGTNRIFPRFGNQAKHSENAGRSTWLFSKNMIGRPGLYPPGTKTFYANSSFDSWNIGSSQSHQSDGQLDLHHKSHRSPSPHS
jgi:hypothetical protein